MLRRPSLGEELVGAALYEEAPEHGGELGASPVPYGGTVMGRVLPITVARLNTPLRRVNQCGPEKEEAPERGLTVRGQGRLIQAVVDALSARGIEIES